MKTLSDFCKKYDMSFTRANHRTHDVIFQVDYYNRTYTSIAKDYGITVERIRQIYAYGIRKLLVYRRRWK